jgi:hypothetical protein
MPDPVKLILSILTGVTVFGVLVWKVGSKCIP